MKEKCGRKYLKNARTVEYVRAPGLFPTISVIANPSWVNFRIALALIRYASMIFQIESPLKLKLLILPQI